MDVAIAGTGLIVAAPVLAVVAGIVRLNMGSPIFFTQTRPGLEGKPFEIVKLRTMRAPLVPNGKLLHDEERLTTLGRWIRQMSIDELPQLWNVVRGDMSLVGPRPLLMDYLSQYSERQARRHHVKPGMTGWAQINGRDIVDWDTVFELDVWYVDHWSLWLDLRILARTATKVVKRALIRDQGNAVRRGKWIQTANTKK